MVSRIHKGNKSDIIVVHFNNLSKGCKSINDTQSDNFVEPFTKIEPSISNVGRTNIPVGSTNRTSKAPWRLRSRAPWFAVGWQGQPWWGIGRCSPSDHLATAEPLRIPRALQQFHCMQTPFYMLWLSFWDHTRLKDPAPSSESCVRYAAVSGYVLMLPAHHLSLQLHQRRDHKYLSSGWTYD